MLRERKRKHFAYIQKVKRQIEEGFARDQKGLTLKLEYNHKRAMKEIEKQVQCIEEKYGKTKSEDKLLDSKIEELNLETSTLHSKRDGLYEKAEIRDDQRRMDIVVLRSKLVSEIQDVHYEIIQLQTELELLRLKTYPTLKYKPLI